MLSFSLYAYLQVQFRNNIFLVSSFFLHINVFKFANTFSQIFLWISYLVFFFSLLLFTYRIRSLSILQTIRNNTEEEYSRSRRFPWKAKFIAVYSVYRTVGRHNASDRWNFPNRSANSPRVWLHFARRSVEGRRIIRSSVHASCCTSWGCAATVWRACALKICNFRRRNAFPTNSIFQSFGLSNCCKLSRIYSIWIRHIERKSKVSFHVWSHYKRCFVSFVVEDRFHTDCFFDGLIYLNTINSIFSHKNHHIF